MAQADAAFESGPVMRLGSLIDSVIVGSAGVSETFAIGLLAARPDVRDYALALGLFGVLTGFLLLLAHKRTFDEAMRLEDSERMRAFEARKYRRRSAVSSMIASTGCLMAALFWVTEPKTFVVFILLILVLLSGVLVIALFDLFSVGLHSISKTDDAARKALVEEYLRQRKKAAFKDPEDK